MMLLMCFALSLSATAQEFRLDVTAEFPTLSSKHIVSVIPLPIKSNANHQYLLAEETGELYLLDNSELVSLPKLSLSNQTNTKQVKLTALTLHPSFSLADQQGYQTFYTAHIEPRKTNNNIARLTILEKPTTLPFDTVITQWQYDDNALNKIDAQQRREVIRIAVPTATHQIHQIAFNPFSKTWHDDYGLMHIALSEHKDNFKNAPKEPLYSGVVLRINPAKFGLRNYMVPNSNPFVKTAGINNEIFILGAQSIHSFAWSKQYYDALLLQHNYAENEQVVVAKKGADWRKSYQKQLVFALNSAEHDRQKLIPYYGRDLKTLIGSVLYLDKNTNNWQLNKLNTTVTNTDIKENPSKKTTYLFNSDKLSPNNKVSLLLDHSGEPLLIDFTKKQLVAVTPVEVVTNSGNKLPTENVQDEADRPNEQADSVNSNTYGKLLLTLLILVLAVVFYRLRPKNNSTKAKLRRQFARFEINETQTELSFYKRHLSTVDSTIAISDIVKSEVLLNGRNISIINKDKDHGYSEQQENQLRLHFTQAHRHKLIDNEVREAQLYLTDHHAKTYVVCLYLRKGNQRLTKAKYFDALESVIDWSWFIALQMNPQATGERPIKISEPVQPIYSPKPTQESQPVVDEENIEVEEEIDKTIESKPTSEELHNIAMHDSELINSLDKLAELKQKGFLTSEEFSLAKSKILSDITDNK